MEGGARFRAAKATQRQRQPLYRKEGTNSVFFLDMLLAPL